MSDKIYVRGLPSEYTKADLRETFEQFGKIKVIKIPKGDNKSFAYIHYQCKDHGALAISAMNDLVHETGIWYVSELMRKHQRIYKLANEFNTLLRDRANKNIFIRNFPEEWTRDNLVEIFSKYGDITSATINSQKHLFALKQKKSLKKQ